MYEKTLQKLSIVKTLSYESEIRTKPFVDLGIR
jgi:hypothetical protein